MSATVFLKISRTWPQPLRTSRSPSKKRAESRASASAGGRYVSARQYRLS